MMKKLLYFSLIFMTIVSCSKDESDISSEEAVKIIGKWIAVSESSDAYGTLTSLEFDAYGIVTLTAADNVTRWGYWTYSKTTKHWIVKNASSNDDYTSWRYEGEGEYTMVGDKLCYYGNRSNTAYVFSRENDSNPSDDSRIYGTWKGDCWGDSFTMTFRNDGTLYEVFKEYSGKVYTDNLRYIFKNGKLTFPDDGEPYVSNAAIGCSPFSIEFSSSENPTWMKLTGDVSSIKMYKQ